MKKILLTLSASFLFLCGFSQGIYFEKGSFDEILVKAKSENKLVFVDVFTEWCGPCKALSKEVFPDERLGKLYNRKFVSLKIDAEKGEGIELARKYNVTGYPTMLFLDSDGKVIHRLQGRENVDFFIKEAAKIELFLKEGNLDRFKQRFDDGERDPKFLLKYYELCEEFRKQKILAAYLLSMSDDQLFNVQNKYLEQIHEYDSTLFHRLIDGLVLRPSNEEEFNLKVTFSVQYLLSGFLDQSIKKGNLNLFNEIRELKKRAVGLSYSEDPDYKLVEGRGLFFASDAFLNLKYTMANSREYEKNRVVIKDYIEDFIAKYPKDTLRAGMVDAYIHYPGIALSVLINQLISVNSYSSLFLLDCVDQYWCKTKTSKPLIADCKKWCNYMYAINPLNYEVAIKAANLLYRMDQSKDAIAILEESIDYQTKYNTKGAKIVELLSDRLEDIKNQK